MAHYTHDVVAKLLPMQGKNCELAPSLLVSIDHITMPGLGMLARLPPEIRNCIYMLIFGRASTYFFTPAMRVPCQLRLRDKEGQSQQNTTQDLQTLGTLSHEIRHEVQTLFYASRSIVLVTSGYEYLPFFVHWLEKMDEECRKVVRSVYLAGHMWYQPSLDLTMRLHHLLRGCSNLRILGLQLNICHFCESCLEALQAYLNYTGSQAHDGPLPQIDVSELVDTILAMQLLETFRLNFVLSLDEASVRAGKEKTHRDFSCERGRELADDVEKRLKGALKTRGYADRTAVFVRYLGSDERRYCGLL